MESLGTGNTEHGDSLITVSAMSKSHDDDEQNSVVDRIEDPIVAISKLVALLNT